MSNAQIRILNAVGWVCVILILGDVIFTQLNLRLNQTVLQTQSQLQPKLNDVQQKYSMLESLAVRIAQSAQQEPLFRDLLVKHDLQVDLTTDGKTKRVP